MKKEISVFMIIAMSFTTACGMPQIKSLENRTVETTTYSYESSVTVTKTDYFNELDDTEYIFAVGDIDYYSDLGNTVAGTVKSGYPVRIKAVSNDGKWYRTVENDYVRVEETTTEFTPIELEVNETTTLYSVHDEGEVVFIIQPNLDSPEQHIITKQNLAGWTEMPMTINSRFVYFDGENLTYFNPSINGRLENVTVTVDLAEKEYTLDDSLKGESFGDELQLTGYFINPAITDWAPMYDEE